MNAGRTRLGCVTAALLLSVVAGLLVWGVVRRNQRRSIEVYVYLAESSQGLSVGSAVLLRGIKVGEVTCIGVASDGRQIEVQSALWWDSLVELGLINPERPFGPERGPFAPPGFYAYLAQVGFTDLRVLQLDFHPAERVVEYPPPADAPWARIPGAQSTPQAMKLFVEQTFSGSGQVLRDGIKQLEVLEARTREVDGAELRARISSQLSDLESLFEGPPWGKQLTESLRRGVEGLHELHTSVAQVQSSLATGKPTELTAQIDDVLETLDSIDPTARADEIQSGLQTQQEAAVELRQSIAELRAALRDAQAWLGGLKTEVEGYSNDRDGLLVSPESAESPPARR